MLKFTQDAREIVEGFSFPSSHSKDPITIVCDMVGSYICGSSTEITLFQNLFVEIWLTRCSPQLVLAPVWVYCYCAKVTEAFWRWRSDAPTSSTGESAKISFHSILPPT